MTDSDISEKLSTLNKSKFRSKFKLARKDRDYIANKGLETIKDHAYQFINSRVAPGIPKNDGKQTPMRGHPVFMPSMPPPHFAGGVFQSGMVSERAGRSMMRRSIMLWCLYGLRWQLIKSKVERERICKK